MRLVLVTGSDSRPKRLAYFAQQARQLAAIWGGASIIPVQSGGDIAWAIETAPDRIDHLAFVCHGWPDRLLARWRGVRLGRHVPPRVVSLAYLLEVLAPRVTRDVHVAIAACWAGADRWQPALTAGCFGPGGARSFAGTLYRGLAPGAPGACVMAHAYKGPTTEAPTLRAWGGVYGVESDGRGASVLDHYLGPGAHLVPLERARWRKLCGTGPERRRASELLLAGEVPAVLR